MALRPNQIGALAAHVVTAIRQRSNAKLVPLDAMEPWKQTLANAISSDFRLPSYETFQSGPEDELINFLIDYYGKPVKPKGKWRKATTARMERRYR